MAKISLLFVEKLVNSSLLNTFPALISKILSNFSLVPDSCKGLTMNFFHAPHPRKQESPR